MIKIKAYSDMVVKYILGRNENKDLLISFINAVFTDSGFPKIIDVEIKNPFNEKEFIEEKDSILDIKAVDEEGRIINLEVQSTGNSSFGNRSLYYGAKAYSSQLKKADDYLKLKPVVCINILNFELIQKTKKYHSCFILRDKDDPALILTDHLMIHFLELPKILNPNYNDKLNRWLSFFKYEGDKEKIMNLIIKNDVEIEKAHEQFKKFTMNKKYRDIYESREKYKKDVATLIESAKLDGKKEGKLETAINMYYKGFGIKDIIEITKVSKKDIERAIKEIK